MAGQTILITGANSGLGLEAAKHCLRLGATRLVLGVRNMSSGDTAKNSLESIYPKAVGRVLVWHLDLLSFASVREFRSRPSALDRLDAVILNAALLTQTWQQFEGFESTLLANVLSQQLLSIMLLPKLRDTAGMHGSHTSMTFVVSESHLVAKFPERDCNQVFETLNGQQGAEMSNR